MGEQWAAMPGLVQQTVQRDGESPTVAFYGNASPFSNFHPAEITAFGVVWPTSEHLFMAHKARFCNDKAVFNQIRRAKTPAEAKRLGRTIKNYSDDGTRFEPFPVEEWNDRSFHIMIGILQKKFSQNGDLMKQLLEVVVDEHGEPAPCKFAEVTKKDARWGTGCDLDAYLRKENLGHQLARQGAHRGPQQNLDGGAKDAGAVFAGGQLAGVAGVAGVAGGGGNVGRGRDSGHGRGRGRRRLRRAPLERRRLARGDCGRGHEAPATRGD